MSVRNLEKGSAGRLGCPLSHERPRGGSLVRPVGLRREILVPGPSMGNRTGVCLSIARHRQGDDPGHRERLHLPRLETDYRYRPAEDLEVDDRPLLCYRKTQGRTPEGHEIQRENDSHPGGQGSCHNEHVPEVGQTIRRPVDHPNAGTRRHGKGDVTQH